MEFTMRKMEETIKSIIIYLTQGADGTYYKSHLLPGRRYALSTYALAASGAPNLEDAINKALEIEGRSFRIKTNQHPCAFDVKINFVELFKKKGA